MIPAADGVEQVYFPSGLPGDTRLSHRAVKSYMLLILHYSRAPYEQASFAASYEELAAAMGCSRRTAIRVMQKLAETGWVAKAPCRLVDGRSPNRWRLAGGGWAE